MPWSAEHGCAKLWSAAGVLVQTAPVEARRQERCQGRLNLERAAVP
jgi:hypothetical protein